MINRNKKGIIVLMALFVAVLMIGIPVSAAATPSTPSYLASGNSMNYVNTTTGYIYTHNYTSGPKSLTYSNNVTLTPTTTYYNVTISSVNSTAVNVTFSPCANEMYSYTNYSIEQAKYMVPIMVKSTSKTIEINEINSTMASGNITYNYTSSSYMPYYKSAFGAVEATEYVISMSEITHKGSSSKAASYKNITGDIYISKANNMVIGYTLTTTNTTVTSGTTAANENYTVTSTTGEAELYQGNMEQCRHG